VVLQERIFFLQFVTRIVNLVQIYTKFRLRVEFVTQHIIWQKNHKTSILKFVHTKLLVNLRNLNETFFIDSPGLGLSTSILLITFNNKVLLRRQYEVNIRCEFYK